MAYILWLLFMAAVVGALAVPVARAMGYSYGRFGRVADLVIVVIGTIILGSALIAVLERVGFETFGTIGALGIGLVIALIISVLLAIFSIKQVRDEDYMQETPDAER